VGGINIDQTPPVITGAPTTTPNANGWYSGPVTIHFICSDALSKIATCPADVVLSADGANQSVTATATDKAGNSASATVSGINIDRTAPALTASPKSGSTFVLGTVLAPTCAAIDSLSGIASACSGTLSGGQLNGVGTFTYTLTATDKAGNTAIATATYYVVYRVDGFLQPITGPTFTEGPDGSISTGGTLLAPAALGTPVRASTFNAGRTVPMKLQLEKADGTIVPANSAPIWLQPVQLGAVSSSVLLGTPGTTPATLCSPSAPSLTPPCLFRSDAVARQYIYNWITPSALQGFYLEMGVQLDDGTIRYAYAALV
jgi:hypothetical protein